MLLHEFIDISIFVIQAFILQTNRFFQFIRIHIFYFFEFFKAQTLFLGAHTALHSMHTKQALRGNVAQNEEI